MSVFWRWIQAVIHHYFLWLGGTAVSVALLFWGQYAPADASRLPSQVWWSGLVIAFGFSCFSSWKEQWQTATTLAIQRPEFAHDYAGLEQWRKTDGTLFERYDIRFFFKNGSGIGVDALTSRVIVMSNFDDPPVGDSGYRTNGNRVMGPTNIRTEVKIVPHMPPHYFAIYLSYKDARTGAKYEQRMFYMWRGSSATEFDMGFRDCTLEERQHVESYVTSRNLLS